MNKDKIIKDLKERNDKLSDQNMLLEIRNSCICKKNEDLEQASKDIKKYILKELLEVESEKEVDWKFDIVPFSDLPAEVIKPILDIIDKALGDDK